MFPEDRNIFSELIVKINNRWHLLGFSFHSTSGLFPPLVIFHIFLFMVFLQSEVFISLNYCMNKIFLFFSHNLIRCRIPVQNKFSTEEETLNCCFLSLSVKRVMLACLFSVICLFSFVFSLTDTCWIFILFLVFWHIFIGYLFYN